MCLTPIDLYAEVSAQHSTEAQRPHSNEASPALVTLIAKLKKRQSRQVPDAS